MKITLRVPMKEAYSYIEIESETQSAEEAVKAYNDITKLVHTPEAQNRLPDLDSKVFNDFIDRYISCEVMRSTDRENFEKMSERQRYVVNELKKSKKRLEAKLEREQSEYGENGTKLKQFKS